MSKDEPADNYIRKVVTVLAVTDGDTIKMIIDLGFDVHRAEDVRMLGYNAAEIHSADPDERECSIIAKRLLVEFACDIQGAVVQTVKGGTDLYGRLLATVWAAGVNVNQKMLDSGIVVPYDGKGARPKTAWAEVLKSYKARAK